MRKTAGPVMKALGIATGGMAASIMLLALLDFLPDSWAPAALGCAVLCAVFFTIGMACE